MFSNEWLVFSVCYMFPKSSTLDAQEVGGVSVRLVLIVAFTDIAPPAGHASGCCGICSARFFSFEAMLDALPAGGRLNHDQEGIARCVAVLDSGRSLGTLTASLCDLVQPWLP